MKNINTLEKARQLFSDAEQLVFTITGGWCNAMIRRLICPDYGIIYYEAHRDNLRVIVSQEAKEVNFPDVTSNYELVCFGHDYIAHLGYVKKYIQITFDINLHEHIDLVEYLGNNLGNCLQSITYYDEVDMGIMMVKGTSYSEVWNLLKDYRRPA